MLRLLLSKKLSDDMIYEIIQYKKYKFRVGMFIEQLSQINDNVVNFFRNRKVI